MNVLKAISCAGGLILVASYGMAQTVGTEVQRDINQQNRIEEGLQSGQLSTGEAARLEKGEARIEKMESKSLKDGTLSSQEAARIQRAQNQESTAIQKFETQQCDGQSFVGLITTHAGRCATKHQSAESHRTGRSIRTAHQQGSFETGAGKSRGNRAEARTGSNGHVGPREQARIQRLENRQSNKIFREKHNNRVR